MKTVITVYYYPIQIAPQGRYACLMGIADKKEVVYCNEKKCNNECRIPDYFSHEFAVNQGLV